MAGQEPPAELSPKEKCQWEICLATVPFYGLREGEVKQNGSGVLFRLAEKHFILTGAHHLKGPLFHEIPYFIGPAGDMGGLIEIGGATTSLFKDEAVDIAAVELSADAVDRLGSVRRFLNILDLDCDPKPVEGSYLLAGYPYAYTEPDDAGVVQTRALRYLTDIYRGQLAAGSVYDADRHILLGFDEQCVDEQGGACSAPHPEGTSGCGIWRFEVDAQGQAWRPEDVKLVAIQHRYYASLKYVMGTWVQFAMSLLWKEYEELRPAMQLRYREWRTTT